MIRVDTKEPLNLLFFVASVSTRVDSDRGEFAPFAPTFEGEGRDAEELSDFADSE